MRLWMLLLLVCGDVESNPGPMGKKFMTQIIELFKSELMAEIKEMRASVCDEVAAIRSDTGAIKRKFGELEVLMLTVKGTSLSGRERERDGREVIGDVYVTDDSGVVGDGSVTQHGRKAGSTRFGVQDGLRIQRLPIYGAPLDPENLPPAPVGPTPAVVPQTSNRIFRPIPFDMVQMSTTPRTFPRVSRKKSKRRRKISKQVQMHLDGSHTDDETFNSREGGDGTSSSSEDGSDTSGDRTANPRILTDFKRRATIDVHSTTAFTRTGNLTSPRPRKPSVPAFASPTRQLQKPDRKYRGKNNVKDINRGVTVDVVPNPNPDREFVKRKKVLREESLTKSRSEPRLSKYSYTEFPVTTDYPVHPLFTNATIGPQRTPQYIPDMRASFHSTRIVESNRLSVNATTESFQHDTYPHPRSNADRVIESQQRQIVYPYTGDSRTQTQLATDIENTHDDYEHLYPLPDSDNKIGKSSNRRGVVSRNNPTFVESARLQKVRQSINPLVMYNTDNTDGNQHVNINNNHNNNIANTNIHKIQMNNGYKSERLEVERTISETTTNNEVESINQDYIENAESTVKRNIRHRAPTPPPNRRYSKSLVVSPVTFDLSTPTSPGSQAQTPLVYSPAQTITRQSPSYTNRSASPHYSVAQTVAPPFTPITPPIVPPKPTSPIVLQAVRNVNNQVSMASSLRARKISDNVPVNNLASLHEEMKQKLKLRSRSVDDLDDPVVDKQRTLIARDIDITENRVEMNRDGTHNRPNELSTSFRSERTTNTTNKPIPFDQRSVRSDSGPRRNFLSYASQHDDQPRTRTALVYPSQESPKRTHASSDSFSSSHRRSPVLVDNTNAFTLPSQRMTSCDIEQDLVFVPIPAPDYEEDDDVTISYIPRTEKSAHRFLGRPLKSVSRDESGRKLSIESEVSGKNKTVQFAERPPEIIPDGVIVSDGSVQPNETGNTRHNANMNNDFIVEFDSETQKRIYFEQSGDGNSRNTTVPPPPPPPPPPIPPFFKPM